MDSPATASPFELRSPSYSPTSAPTPPAENDIATQPSSPVDLPVSAAPPSPSPSSSSSSSSIAKRKREDRIQGERNVITELIQGASTLHRTLDDLTKDNAAWTELIAAPVLKAPLAGLPACASHHSPNGLFDVYFERKQHFTEIGCKNHPSYDWSAAHEFCMYCIWLNRVLYHGIMEAFYHKICADGIQAEPLFKGYRNIRKAWEMQDVAWRHLRDLLMNEDDDALTCERPFGPKVVVEPALLNRFTGQLEHEPSLCIYCKDSTAMLQDTQYPTLFEYCSTRCMKDDDNDDDSPLPGLSLDYLFWEADFKCLWCNTYRGKGSDPFCNEDCRTRFSPLAPWLKLTKPKEM